MSSNIIFTFPKINNSVKNIFMKIAFLIFLDISFREKLIFVLCVATGPLLSLNKYLKIIVCMNLVSRMYKMIFLIYLE